MHTGARARKQKYISMKSIYLYENLFENGCIYIYIYNRYGQKTNDHKKSSNIKQNVTSLKKVLALKELLYAL